MTAWLSIREEYHRLHGERLDLALARALGVHHRTVRKWLEGTAVPSDRHAQIADFLGPELGARWVEALAGDGLSVVPRLTGNFIDGCELPHLCGQIDKFAAYLHRINVSVADGRIDPAEAAQIKERARDVVRAINAFADWAARSAKGAGL